MITPSGSQNIEQQPLTPLVQTSFLNIDLVAVFHSGVGVHGKMCIWRNINILPSTFCLKNTLENPPLSNSIRFVNEIAFVFRVCTWSSAFFVPEHSSITTKNIFNFSRRDPYPKGPSINVVRFLFLIWTKVTPSSSCVVWLNEVAI